MPTGKEKQNKTKQVLRKKNRGILVENGRERQRKDRETRMERGYGRKSVKRAVIHLSHAEMSTKVTSPHS